MRIAGEGTVDGLLDGSTWGRSPRLPSETSIGQQQRAALARALGLRPAVLLADEPTSHQDGRSAARVWQAIEAARDSGTACLIATHDGAAAAHADRVWELVDGRLASATRWAAPR
jgi:putative ABC transport system ATP-binding protein